MIFFLKYAALCGLVCFPIQSGANQNTIGAQTAPYLRPANQTGPYKKRVIVFVQGLFGNFDGTWRFSPQVYWPQLLLSDATFNDSDIYVASYASPLVGGRMNIEDIVSNLDNRLKSDYVFSKHREVIFVCHSLGGLIVEKLLLKNRDYDVQVPFIYFFGTPQTGADIATFVKLFSSDPLIKDLSASEDNEILQGIEDDWRAAHFRIRSYCAYEIQKFHGVVVVDRLSATRNCTEKAVAIDENHVGMVKPSGVHHDSYVALVNAVRDNPIATEKPQVTRKESSSATPTVRLDAHVQPGPYPEDFAFAGIVWRKEYSDVRLDISIDKAAIRDLDLVVALDTTIAGIGQITQFPGVTAFPVEGNISAFTLEGTDEKGNKVAIPISPTPGNLSAAPKYRVHCTEIFANTVLRLAIASIALNPPNPDGSLPSQLFALRRDPQSIRLEGSYKSESNSYPVKFSKSF
jgi:hypothetical protein